MQNTRPTFSRFYYCQAPGGEFVLLGSAFSSPTLKPDLRPVPSGRSLGKSLTFFFEAKFEIDDAYWPEVWATFSSPEPARDLQKHDLVRDLMPLLPQHHSK